MNQVVAFEFVEDFDFAKLQKCATNEKIFGRVFVCRHGDYGFQWKLGVQPKDKRGEKEPTFGLFLRFVDCPDDLSASFGLFAGDKEVCRSVINKKFERKDNSATDVWGFSAFLPNVTSLEERGLVVDGVVKLGVKIVLEASVFDPFYWLPTPSLTPDTSRIARQLFDNLGTDDHRFTDFITAVGTGDARKELHVSRFAFRAVPCFDQFIDVMEDQEGVLHLPTHTADAVIEAIRFVYLNEIAVDLTQFLPSLFILASEWELKPLLTEIQRAMITKLQTDRTNTDLAVDYLELAVEYNRKVVGRVATCILVDAWPQFVLSPKGKGMKEQMKYQVTCVMAAAAVYKGVYTGMDSDWLTPLPAPSLISNGALGQYFAANLGTDDHLGTDFVIAVGQGEAKKELHVNRLALRVVPFFARMFGNNAWKENQQGVLCLPTHTVDAAMEALRFVYQNEVGVNLTRFLPSLLSLASEWELNDLMVAIERDMVKKLMDDRFGYDHETAAEYLQLADKYNRKVVGRVAIRKLIEAWPMFSASQKGKDMDVELKNKVTCAMAAIASGTPIDDGE